MGTVISIIFILILAIALICGLKGGFGKVLTFATKGFFGKIFTIIVWYSIFGLVLNIGFISELLINFVSYLKDNPNVFTKILLFVRIELIAFAVLLYFIVKILLKLLAQIICTIMDSEVKVIVIINKVLGVVLAMVLALLVVLILFQILYWISGPTGGVYRVLSEGFMGLDKLYLDNPLLAIIDRFMR